MKTPKEQAATIALMAICAVLGGLWVKNQPNVDEESKNSNPPLLVLENSLAYRFDERGKKSLNLKTPKTVHYQDERGTQFFKPLVINFFEGGEKTLNSDFAWENQERTKIELQGKVVGISPHKKGGFNEIRTDKAIYFIDEKRAITDEPIEIKTPESLTNAIGAAWFLNSDIFQLKKKVRTIYEQKK